LVILHLQIGLEVLLKPTVKVDHMGIGVIQERSLVRCGREGDQFSDGKVLGGEAEEKKG